MFFFLQVLVNRSIGSTDLFRLLITDYCSIGTDQNEKRSDFIPQAEFIKSEIGIRIKRNFPAGRNVNKSSASTAVEGRGLKSNKTLDNISS